MRRYLPAAGIALAPLVVVPGGVDFAHLPQSLYTQALALGALSWAIATGRLPWRLSPPDALLCAALAWAALSLAWTPDRLTGLTLITQGIGCAAAYLLARWGPWSPRTLLAGVFAAGVAVAAIGLAQLVGLDWPQRAVHLGATLGNPNAASHIVVLALPCALVVPGGAGAAGALVLAGYLAATGSTTACVAALVMLAALGWHWYPDRDERPLVLVLALFMAVSATWTGALRFDVEPRGSAGQRLAMVTNTVPMIVDHPLGVGLGGWAVTYPKYAQAVVPDPVYGLDTQPRRAHNDYVQGVAEFGVVGMLTALACLFSLTLGVKALKTAPALALLGLAVLALASFPLQLPAASWLAAICLGCALREPMGLIPRNPRHCSHLTAGAIAGLALILVAYHVTAIRADHHLRAAQEAARAQDWPAMEQGYLEAWRLRPLDGRALSHAGVAMLMQGRGAEAAAALEASLELRPNQLHALSDLAVALSRLRRGDEARHFMARALELAPRSRRLRLNAARLDVDPGE